MFLCPPPTDLDPRALAIARMGSDQPDDVRASLAWVIRNRLERIAARQTARRSIIRACADILREALGQPKPNLRAPDLPEAEWRRIHAVNGLVWAGEVMDQTGGATACHRHDLNPSWARDRIPTALLGPYLFFR